MPNKPPFSWDNEIFIGSVLTGENTKINVNFAQKNNKGYINIVKLFRKGNKFIPTKGIALPYDAGQQISVLIDRAIKEGQKYNLQTNWNSNK